MKSIMRLLPFVLGLLIIILLVMHFVLGGNDEKTITTDDTNKVIGEELTLGGKTEADDTPTPKPTKKPGKNDNDKNSDTNKDKSEDDTEVSPTPIINDNEVIDDDGNIGADGTGNEFGLKFDEKQDFVFIKAGSRIRAGASTDTGIIGEVAEETKLERTGYNSEWTRVVYNQMECYVATSLVIRSTTDASVTPAATPTPVPTENVGTNGYTFESKSDLVEIKAGSRIRAGASTNAEIVTELSDDAVLDRIGYNSEWTKVLYNGKECYVATQLVKRTVDKYGTTVDDSGKPVENTGDNNTDNSGTENGNTGSENNNTDEKNENNGTETGDDGNSTTGDNGGSVEETPVEITFNEKNDYVEIKAGSRIRTSATTVDDDNIIATTSAVSRVKRTGSSKEWARVEYNGQTCYIANSVITVSMSEEQAKAADEADRLAAENEASNNDSSEENSDGNTTDESEQNAEE